MNLHDGKRGRHKDGAARGRRLIARTTTTSNKRISEVEEGIARKSVVNDEDAPTVKVSRKSAKALIKLDSVTA